MGLNMKDQPKKSAFNSVIFDLDGTLLYTLPDIARVINSALSMYGYPEHETEFYRTAVGWGLYEAVRISLPEERRSDEIITLLEKKVISEYQNKPVVDTVPYEGIKELLKTLHKKGIRISVLSNKDDGLTKEVVSLIFGTELFDAVRGRFPDIPAKPDPAGALLIMEQMGVSPEEVIYVGDSDVDMETAVRGGMYPVGVLWGYRSREDIHKGGAEMIVREPKEILSLFTDTVISTMP